MLKCPKCGYKITQEKQIVMEADLVRALWRSFKILHDKKRERFRWKDIEAEVGVDMERFKNLVFFEVISFDPKSGYHMPTSTIKNFFRDMVPVYTEAYVLDGVVQRRMGRRKLSQLPNMAAMLTDEGVFDWIEAESRRT